MLVAINSVFQVVAFGALGWFNPQVLPSWLGSETTSAGFSVWAITASVLVLLGIPLAAGFLTRPIGERTKGRAYLRGQGAAQERALGLYGLLFTIVILFARRANTITAEPGHVARNALASLVHFAVTFSVSCSSVEPSSSATPGPRPWRSPRPATTSSSPSPWPSPPSASPRAKPWPGWWDRPLIEVPVLVGLVYVALWSRRHLIPETVPSPGSPAQGV